MSLSRRAIGFVRRCWWSRPPFSCKRRGDDEISPKSLCVAVSDTQEVYGPASATIPGLDCGAPNGSSSVLPFSAIDWRAISKNRVKPAAARHSAEVCAL